MCNSNNYTTEIKKDDKKLFLEFEIKKLGFGENAKSVLVYDSKTMKDSKESYFFTAVVEDANQIENLANKVKVDKPDYILSDMSKAFAHYVLHIKKFHSVFIKYLDGSLQSLDSKDIENIFFHMVKIEKHNYNFGPKHSILIKFKDTIKEKGINLIFENADKIMFKEQE